MVWKKLKQYFVRKDLYEKGLVYGSYSLLDETRLAANFVQPNGIVFDVGANAGVWTSALLDQLRLLGKEAQVYCFEPDLSHAECLQALTVTENVKYVPCGLSSEVTTGLLYGDQERSGLSSLYLRDLAHYGINMSLTQTVKLLTLDSFLQDTGVSHIDFLKIDVEGHELEVLRGGSAALHWDNIKAIQFEFGGCNIDSRTFFRDFHRLLVLQHGFRLFRIAPHSRLVDISRYDESLEIFSWQNILAIKEPIPKGWHS